MVKVAVLTVSLVTFALISVAPVLVLVPVMVLGVVMVMAMVMVMVVVVLEVMVLAKLSQKFRNSEIQKFVVLLAKGALNKLLR